MTDPDPAALLAEARAALRAEPLRAADLCGRAFGAAPEAALGPWLEAAARAASAPLYDHVLEQARAAGLETAAAATPAPAAWRALAAGERDAAARLAAAAADDPATADLGALVEVQLRLLGGDEEGAWIDLRRLVERTPSLGALRLALRLATRRRDEDELRRLLDGYPLVLLDAPTLLLAAEFRAQDGERADAQRAIRTLLERGQGLTESMAAEALQVVDTALDHLDPTSRLDRLLELTAIARQRFPRSDELRLAEVSFLLAQGRYEQVRGLLSTLPENDARTHQTTALLHLRLAEDAPAVAAGLRALRAGERAPHLVADLARACQRLGDRGSFEELRGLVSDTRGEDATLDRLLDAIDVSLPRAEA